LNRSQAEFGFHFSQALPKILDDDLVFFEAGIQSCDQHDQNNKEKDG
jgi:hypothetical protein